MPVRRRTRPQAGKVLSVFAVISFDAAAAVGDVCAVGMLGNGAKGGFKILPVFDFEEGEGASSLPALMLVFFAGVLEGEGEAAAPSSSRLLDEIPDLIDAGGDGKPDCKLLFANVLLIPSTPMLSQSVPGLPFPFPLPWPYPLLSPLA